MGNLNSQRTVESLFVFTMFFDFNALQFAHIILVKNAIRISKGTVDILRHL